MEAKAFVGETLACEAVMMAQVVKNKKLEMINAGYIRDARRQVTSRGTILLPISWATR